ncbi:MAG: hypothetical protein EOO38_03970 [Cytophagaceae bacterium]|nr:MAG: hypothetical protein EOO38_03970 [Cytophagaceae bacterium]
MVRPTAPKGRGLGPLTRSGLVAFARGTGNASIPGSRRHAGECGESRGAKPLWGASENHAEFKIFINVTR